MSSFQGTTVSGYEGIAPYRLYLDISNDDREFTTNIINPLAYSERSIDHTNYSVSRPTNGLSYDTWGGDSNSTLNSTYGIISRYTQLQQFKSFIDTYNLKQKMVGDFTMFVPIDSLDGVSYIDQKLQDSVLDPLDIYNFHTLDYAILPCQLFDKKIRLQTKLRNQYILANNMNIVSNSYAWDLGININEPSNKILNSIKTDNGYIYITERPLFPYVY